MLDYSSIPRSQAQPKNNKFYIHIPPTHFKKKWQAQQQI